MDMLGKLFKVTIPLVFIILCFVFPWFSKHKVATIIFWYPCAFIALVLYLNHFKELWNSED